jgi:hypothetical protein
MLFFKSALYSLVLLVLHLSVCNAFVLVTVLYQLPLLAPESCRMQSDVRALELISCQSVRARVTLSQVLLLLLPLTRPHSTC